MILKSLTNSVFYSMPKIKPTSLMSPLTITLICSDRFGCLELLPTHDNIHLFCLTSLVKEQSWDNWTYVHFYNSRTIQFYCCSCMCGRWGGGNRKKVLGHQQACRERRRWCFCLRVLLCFHLAGEGLCEMRRISPDRQNRITNETFFLHSILMGQEFMCHPSAPASYPPLSLTSRQRLCLARSKWRIRCLSKSVDYSLNVIYHVVSHIIKPRTNSFWTNKSDSWFPTSLQSAPGEFPICRARWSRRIHPNQETGGLSESRPAERPRLL